MTSRSRNCSTLEGGNQKDRFATIFRVVAFPEHGVGSPVVRCHIGVFCITSPALCIISIADDILTLSLWSQGASAQLLQIPQMVWRHRNGEIASRKSVTSYFDILWLTTVFSRLLFRRSFSLVVSSEPPTGQDLKKTKMPVIVRSTSCCTLRFLKEELIIFFSFSILLDISFRTDWQMSSVQVPKKIFAYLAKYRRFHIIPLAFLSVRAWVGVLKCMCAWMSVCLYESRGSWLPVSNETDFYLLSAAYGVLFVSLFASSPSFFL